MKMFLCICAVCIAIVSQEKLAADVIVLANSTATHSQTGGGCFPCGPNQAVDGNFGPDDATLANGWSIANAALNDAESQSAVWETVNDLMSLGISIELHFNHFNPQHLLGRFRFSITTDDRNTFADGLAIGGDVTANWIVLSNPQVVGPNGMTFTTLSDQSILAGGSIPDTGMYRVRYDSPLSGVTGIRLEAIEDANLPFFAGPGLHSANGNFILTEMVVTSVPEPTTPCLLMALAGYAIGLRRRRIAW